MSRRSVAKAVRLNKEKHPERYCTARGCLWRVNVNEGECPNHAALTKCREEMHGEFLKTMKRHTDSFQPLSTINGGF